MHKQYTLIACLALGLVGCATTQGAQVYLPGSDLSFGVRKNVATSQASFITVADCMYHFDDDIVEARKSCPTVMRLDNLKNASVIFFMAFPVRPEKIINDTELLDVLSVRFDDYLYANATGTPKEEPHINSKDRVEVNLTWNTDHGVAKERVVVFRVKGKKESTVITVGQWPAGVHQEMVGVQNQIIADILAKSK